jgi:hypothetical protein
MPLTAVPIKVTAMIPMITPSAVRAERVMFDRICATAMRQLSVSSQKNRFIFLQCA